MIYSFLSTALPLSFLSLLPTSTPASDLLLNPFIFFWLPEQLRRC